MARIPTVSGCSSGIDITKSQLIAKLGRWKLVIHPIFTSHRTTGWCCWPLKEATALFTASWSWRVSLVALMEKIPKPTANQVSNNNNNSQTHALQTEKTRTGMSPAQVSWNSYQILHISSQIINPCPFQNHRSPWEGGSGSHRPTGIGRQKASIILSLMSFSVCQLCFHMCKMRNA